ncbi:MAG: hypothetical protein ACSLFR_19255 [Solirubrobacteraceae bacterium]
MEMRAMRPETGPAVVVLSGSAQAVDTATLLDQLVSACGQRDGIVELRDVPTVTSPLFGVLQATARRLHRDGRRLIVVCPEADLVRLRAMRAGRDFSLASSVVGAQWELQRAPSRFQRT